MRRLIILVLFIIFSKFAYANIIINEIMADPVADETLNEWVELYNNDGNEINVSDWVIGDGNDNDTIEGGLYNKEGTIIPAYGYAIITDDATRVYNNFNVSDYAVRLYVDDASIGNGLSNSGETIYIYDSNRNSIDSVTYNKTEEGLSWALINETWHLAEPTPGYNNNGTFVLATEQGCDFSVEIILAKTVFDNSSEFNFRLRASKINGVQTNITGRASIEDLFGTVIREYRPWTNESITRQKTSSTYTPELEEGKSYVINVNATVQCNDTNLDNNFYTGIITIKGKPLQKESSLKIESIYDLGNDDEAKFGQTIRIKAIIYKGDTTKNSVAAWIEDNKGNKLSKQSKTSIFEKYTNNTLTLPIQINPNCDKEFKDKEYKIILEGLDKRDEKEIDIAGIDNSLLNNSEISSHFYII